jgi:hypothetical protein
MQGGAGPASSQSETIAISDGEQFTPQQPEPNEPRLMSVSFGATRSDALPGSFLSARDITLMVRYPGFGVETVCGLAVSSLGTHTSLVAPLLLDASGTPHLVFKAGDARPSRVLRGDDYVKPGMVAGWWDKPRLSDMQIAHEELAEECNATPVENGMKPLGQALLPTMPHEATEGDRYASAIVLLGTGAGVGDGTRNEAAGDLRPMVFGVDEAFNAMRHGDIGGPMRARVAFTRALDASGYIRPLHRYVFDLPAGLRERYTTLGLGEPLDPRALQPAQQRTAPPPHLKLASITSQDSAVVVRDSVPLGPQTALLDVEAAPGTSGAYRNQVLHTDYDRAKVAVFYQDPERGPMVYVERGLRPAWMSTRLATPIIPEDLIDVTTPTSDDHAQRAVSETLAARGWHAVQPHQLGSSSDASPGVSDLRYRSFAAEIEPPSDTRGFVSLAEAMSRCRGGDGGDAATEATLGALADDVGWIPTLGMTVQQAQALSGEPPS